MSTPDDAPRAGPAPVDPVPADGATVDAGATARRAASTLGWSSVGTIAMFAANAVSLVVLSRILSPEVFGAMAAATTIGVILRGIGPISISQAMIGEDASPAVVRAGTTLAWLVTGVMAVGLVLFASPLASLFGVSESAWLFRAWSLVIIAQGVSAAPQTVLQHELEFKKLSISQTVATVVGNGIVPIVLGLLGLELMALFAGVLTVALLEVVTLSYLVRRVYLPDPRAPLGRVARSTSVFSATITTSMISTNGDNLIVGATLGSTALGLYSRAYRLMSLPAIVVGDAVDTALFPVIRRARAELDLIAKGVEVANTLLALVLLPVTAVCIADADLIVTTILGSQWVDAIPIFRILACGMFFRVGTKPFAAVLRGSGNQHRLAGVTSANAVMIVVGSLIGKAWGTSGVATAVVLSLVVYYGLMVSTAMRAIERPTGPIVAKLAGIVPVAAVSGLVASAATRSLDSLPDLLVLVIAFGLAALPALAALALPPYRRVATTVIGFRTKGAPP